jgi:hypothetical protein
MSIIKVEGRGEYERVHQLGNSLPHIDTYCICKNLPRTRHLQDREMRSGVARRQDKELFLSGQWGGGGKIIPGERNREEAEGEGKYEVEEGVGRKKKEWWNRRAEDEYRYRRGRQVNGRKRKSEKEKSENFRRRRIMEDRMDCPWKLKVG